MSLIEGLIITVRVGSPNEKEISQGRCRSKHGEQILKWGEPLQSSREGARVLT